MAIAVEKLTTVVLSQIERGWIVRCGKCRGSGIEPRCNETSCTSCGGAGLRKLPLPADADISLDWGPLFCGHCEGTGIQPRCEKTSCDCCDGRGVQVGTFPRVKCAKCNGSGIEPTYEKKVCTANGCNGSGTIYIGCLR